LSTSATYRLAVTAAAAAVGEQHETKRVVGNGEVPGEPSGFSGYDHVLVADGRVRRLITWWIIGCALHHRLTCT
jgi:hypothetical protein